MGLDQVFMEERQFTLKGGFLLDRGKSSASVSSSAPSPMHPGDPAQSSAIENGLAQLSQSRLVKPAAQAVLAAGS
jgi:hypothetical protein